MLLHCAAADRTFTAGVAMTSLSAVWVLLFVLLVPAVIVLSTALILAFEFAAMAAFDRNPQTPKLEKLLRAWRGELWASLRLVFWRMPLSRLKSTLPRASADTGKRGLVLVHGYGCNRSIWHAWLARLEAHQIPAVAVNLTPVFASIDDYRRIIEAAVVDLQQRSGHAPVLVAHSMGGLAARCWWAQDPSAQRLHRLITVGSPHQGTWMAKLGWGANARQMRPQSAWLVLLQERETTEHARRTICYQSDCDNMVFPSGAALLVGADNRSLSGTGHVALVDHPDVFAAALRCLEAEN
jgi:triacylglycerol esterase/lipase EstA (alpha/beta hydrolase family)